MPGRFPRFLLLSLETLTALMLSGCVAFSGYEVIEKWSQTSTGANPKEAAALCSGGKKVLGGGAVVAFQSGNSFPEDGQGILYMSSPTADNNGWQAGAVNSDPTHQWAVKATAYCAKVTP